MDSVLAAIGPFGRGRARDVTGRRLLLSLAVSFSTSSSSGESYAISSEGSSQAGDSAVGEEKPGMEWVGSIGDGGEMIVAGGRRSVSAGALEVDLGGESARADGGGTEGESAISSPRLGDCR